MVKACEKNRKDILKIISLLTDREAGEALAAIKCLSDDLWERNCTELNSECMSLMGFANYLADKNNYKSSLETINEAAFLADYANNQVCQTP